MFFPEKISIISRRRSEWILSRVLGWQLINIRVEQIVLQIDLLDQHTGVEQIGLIDVQIVRIIAFERLGVDKVLD